MVDLKKHSMQDLIILEEMIDKRIPDYPKYDHTQKMTEESREEFERITDEYQKEWRRELLALERIRDEIYNRMGEIIMDED